MKSVIKNCPLMLLLILVNSRKAFAQETDAVDRRFESALVKLVINYPSFDKLKGKMILNTNSATGWESTENLPGSEGAVVVSTVIMTIKNTYWSTYIIRTTDSTVAINKFREVSEKISSMKFDCCSLSNNDQNSDIRDSLKDSTANKKSFGKVIVWDVASVNEGKKNSKFVDMGITLTLSLKNKSTLIEYFVSLKIAEDIVHKLSPILKKN